MPNIERLTKAAEVLDRVKEEKLPFDLDGWAGFVDKDGDLQEEPMDNACGTSACAAGYCGLDPWFREQGFALTFDSQVVPSIEAFNAIGRKAIAGGFTEDDFDNGDLVFDINYQGNSSWRAIARFFDLESWQAHRLFDADEYSNEDDHKTTAAEVAARIREFIKEISP